MDETRNAAEAPAATPVAEKRVILSMGGKGGVGIMPPAGLCRIESASPNSNGSAGVFEAA